jgi:hypothetical protein
MLFSCSAYSSTLKMESIYSSETSDNFQRTTRRYAPEGGSLKTRKDLEGNVCGIIRVLYRHLPEWNDAQVGENPSESLESPLNAALSCRQSHHRELVVTVYQDRCRCSRMSTVTFSGLCE